MTGWRQARGVSLLELLTVVAVIGIISAVALPAYQSYIDTSNMAKVNAAYQSAMRTAQNVFAKAKTNAALGLATGIPESLNRRGEPRRGRRGRTAVAEGWMDILNPTDIEAPGGGPAYVPATQVGQDEANAVGAIRLDWNANRRELTIWRPKYLELTRYRARVTQDSVETREYQD